MTGTTQGERLCKLAEAIMPKLAEMRRPSAQNPTPKRMRQWADKGIEADRLDRTRAMLVAIGRAMIAGECPGVLQGVRAKAEVVEWAQQKRDSRRASYYIPAPETGEWYDQTEKATAARSLAGLEVTGEEAAQAQAARELERDVHAVRLNHNVPGFFPTPETVIGAMIDRARAVLSDLDGKRALEPSAGIGHIADRLQAVGAAVDCFEVSPTLADILQRKGYSLAGSDFLDARPNGKRYDAVLMNPPFEKRADAEHIRHAWDFVAPGGVLVAVASEGLFCGSDRKATAFRAWLADVGAEDEQLPAGAFSGSGAFRNTGARCRLVVIVKPGAPEGEATFALTAPPTSRDERSVSREYGSTQLSLYDLS